MDPYVDPRTVVQEDAAAADTAAQTAPDAAYLNKKGIMQFPYLRVTVVVALIVVLAIYLMLKYTRFGRSIYAVGGNQQSATLMGLDVSQLFLLY